VIWVGMRSTSWRRSRADSSVASARALPMWPCAAREANAAIAGSTPNTAVSAAATSAVEGVASMRWRQRERMVGRTSSVLGAQSTQTVPGVGSSMLLSRSVGALRVEPVGVLEDEDVPRAHARATSPSGARARGSRRRSR